MIDEALEKLGVGRAILVVHSWSGALGSRMALDYPRRVAGLVMLAPVAYPWPGGVGWYNKVVTTPVIGPLLAYTITLPLGFFLTESGSRGAFLPQIVPENFVKNTATPLLLRPREFLANAQDLVTLKAAVAFTRKTSSGSAMASGRSAASTMRWTLWRSGSPKRAGATLRQHQGADGGDRGRRRQDRVDQHPFPTVRGRGAECETDRIAGCRPHGAERRARACDLRDRRHDRRDCAQRGCSIRDGSVLRDCESEEARHCTQSTMSRPATSRCSAIVRCFVPIAPREPLVAAPRGTRGGTGFRYLRLPAHPKHHRRDCRRYPMYAIVIHLRSPQEHAP